MEQQTFDLLLLTMSALAVVVFAALYYVRAGYGMFQTSKWGISLNNKLGWILMEAPVFFVMLYLWWNSSVRCSAVPLVFFLLFELHYFQRAFIFPFLMKGKSRMPIAIMLMGVVFNVLNGFMQGEWLFYLAPEGLYSDAWLNTSSFWAGLVLFLAGMGINIHSDSVIRHLRKPGDTRHYLPQKGMYRYVTSGNYFGELLEWVGFAVLTCSPAAWVFVLWTFANLAPRANSIRNRYREEFGAQAVGGRNRTIRSAAFESMCPGNVPSQQLLDYHRSVAAGGVGMTTIAYAAVAQSGLSFDRQLWMRPEIVPGLKDITDAIHKEGAAAGIQLGHCGNMSHKSICGVTPVGASSGFNLYSPTFVRGLRKDELPAMAKAYGRSVNLAREAGFDAVEIHAGHGYLISQFLSPYTNHRKDEYGGSLENRMRFMDMVMEEVMQAAGSDMAVLVKMNMRDGFKGGMEIDETMQVAKRLVQDGAQALVLSGGFVSKAPMYVMRGEMPIKTMTHYMNCWWLKYGVRMAGKWMIPAVPFKEAYFLEDALKFRTEIKDIPLVYVGGLVSREKIDEVLNHGFEFVQMARALLNEPGFVNRMREEEKARCNCKHSNYCIARMYTIEMACHQHLREELPASLKKEIEKLEKK